QMKRIIYVPHDLLNKNFGALRLANKKDDLIVLIESARTLKYKKWHSQRLQFIISSARHFAAELTADGYQVIYHQAKTTVDGLKEIAKQNKIEKIVTTFPTGYQRLESLRELSIEFVDNDFFLTPTMEFKDWADSQKSFKMESFYRKQRLKFNLLMEGKDPLGGEWNYDHENRNPVPKDYQAHELSEFEFDEIDKEVADQVAKFDTWGNSKNKYWATTRKQALLRLNEFIKYNFKDFGAYEDAMPVNSWSVNHSVISPYLNNGLLHPMEVVQAAIKAFEKGEIPLASCEGFIRQIIGWREYVNGMYWYLREQFRDENQLAATRKLLPLFEDSTKTKMNCVSSIVSDIEERAWTHHIPRLMVLSNLANLTGVSPAEFLDWMRRVFVDATDWVMVPNVIGMGLHADGGKMMTKPYVSGGAYISKMGQYCKGCKYDPKVRVGEDACPFTLLYWNYLDQHEERFKKNHRMFQQINGLKRLKDLDEVRLQAKKYLKLLSNGEI
ncbi:MAG: cryptochrome/photolyase family protein, partial [Actinomycetes bacterium]